MPVTIFSVEELRRRTLNRLDGKPASGGVESCQIGTATLELEPAHVVELKLQRALDRWVRKYIAQYNRDMTPTRTRMIGARVVGLEIVKLFEP
jgi:hypothetical protein